MNVKDRLIKELLKTEDARTYSGGTEIAVKCPKCKMDHPNSGPHLYIEATNEETMRIDCKHCPLSGVLTPDLLHELGIDNIEFDEYLNKLNRANVKKVHFVNDRVTNIKIPNNPNKNDLIRIMYSSERTGIDFTKDDNIKKYKMMYNLNDFLRMNNIELNEDPNYIKEISDNCIGFLSYNNNTINMRNLSSKLIKKRYVNLKINKNINYPFLYIAPNMIDLLTPNPKIIVAEGVYDILCIKERFFTEDTNNIIFGAVGSSGSYKRSILKLIQLTCFFGSDIYIFSDKDVPLNTYQDNFGKNIATFSKMYVYYNKLNKDFGDIRESYNLEKYRIKPVSL